MNMTWKNFRNLLINNGFSEEFSESFTPLPWISTNTEEFAVFCKSGTIVVAESGRGVVEHAYAYAQLATRHITQEELEFLQKNCSSVVINSDNVSIKVEVTSGLGTLKLISQSLKFKNSWDKFPEEFMSVFLNSRESFEVKDSAFNKSFYNELWNIIKL